MARHSLPPDFNALISLLDDPDTEAFTVVRDRISAFGPIAVPSLEEAWENAFNPVMQKRIEELVHQIQFDQVYASLQEWLMGGAQDLLSAYLLVTRYQYPDLNEEKINTLIDHIVRDIWLELNSNLTALEQIKVFNHLFYQVYKFQNITTQHPVPENFYLNILLESRQGTSLSLGMLYMIVAQRLNIPIHGVDLPQYFVLAYTNLSTNKQDMGVDAPEIHFYVNPFSRGVVFNQKELIDYLKHIDMEPDEKYYMPCRNVHIVGRLVLELRMAYLIASNEEKAAEMHKLEKLVDRYRKKL